MFAYKVQFGKKKSNVLYIMCCQNTILPIPTLGFYDDLLNNTFGIVKKKVYIPCSDFNLIVMLKL